MAWWNFFSPAIDHFSPSETCFLWILAHCMYLSFGATLALEQFGICNSTVWSVGVPAILTQWIINECVLCLKHARCIAGAGHKPSAYTILFFKIKERTMLMKFSVVAWHRFLLCDKEARRLLSRRLVKRKVRDNKLRNAPLCLICFTPYILSMQMFLFTRPGQLFPGIQQRITAFLNVIVYIACSLNHFIFILPQFYEMLPREEICIVGLLEKKKKREKTAVLPF